MIPMRHHRQLSRVGQRGTEGGNEKEDRGKKKKKKTICQAKEEIWLWLV